MTNRISYGQRVEVTSLEDPEDDRALLCRSGFVTSIESVRGEDLITVHFFPGVRSSHDANVIHHTAKFWSGELTPL